jgi:hypothetical protein
VYNWPWGHYVIYVLCIMLNISSNNGARFSQFCMKIPAHKLHFQFLYDWPWPAFRVAMGHWPIFALYMITYVIIKLGSSNFAWMFPTPSQYFGMCILDLDLLSMSLKVIDLNLHYEFTLCLIYQVIMVLGSSNFAWRFLITIQHFSMCIVDMTYIWGQYRSFSYYSFLFMLGQ